MLVVKKINRTHNTIAALLRAEQAAVEVQQATHMPRPVVESALAAGKRLSTPGYDYQPITSRYSFT